MDPEFRAMDTEGKLEYLYNLSLSKDAIIETLNSTNYNQEQEISVIKVEADQFFLIVIAIVIFFMQCGFAFLEAGAVR